MKNPKVVFEVDPRGRIYIPARTSRIAGWPAGTKLQAVYDSKEDTLTLSKVSTTSLFDGMSQDQIKQMIEALLNKLE